MRSTQIFFVLGCASALVAVPHSTAAPPLIPAYTPAPVTPIYATGKPYHPPPQYGVTAVPPHYPHYAAYSPTPRHYAHQYLNHVHQQPYHAAPPPRPTHHKAKVEYGPPSCSKNTTATYCLVDYEYPTYDVQQAVEYHYSAVAALYKDVIANTDNSIDRLKHLSEETYLCPSETGYVMPLRAVNTEGKWRVIVNQVKAHYETLSQTVRVEKCNGEGHPCPLVPECYETKCVQKFVYHRFLVYDPHDYYFPFAMESFKLPSACACQNADYKFVSTQYN